MKLNTVLAALVLALVPALASAECFGSHEQVTMSCAEGTQWDADTRTCVPTTSS